MISPLSFVGILPVLVLFGCGGGSNGSALRVTAIAATANPLVAQYSIKAFSKNLTAWVEFGPDTNYGRQTSTKQGIATLTAPLTILVAGMKPNTTYHMRAHVEAIDGESWVAPDQTFKTGAIPISAGTLPGIVVTHPTLGLTPSSGVEVFNLVAPKTYLQAIVTDIDGNIIWYYNPGNGASPTPMKLMDNGHFLMNVGDLREVDLAGNIIRSVTTEAVNQSLQANGYSFSISVFHHDIIVLPNGHWITLANTSKQFTDLQGYPGVTEVLGDALIDIDLNGNVAWAWSGFDHLDVNRHLMGLPDWTHSNAIVYAPDGNLLLSMRHQSWILKIDYANGAGGGDIIWKLGNDGDFTIAGGDASNWFFAQHYPNIETSSGSLMTLAIMDNGDLRVDSSGADCTTTCYSRATLFQVDEATNVASLVWQDLPGFYSFWGGSIGILDNGDVEFDLSTVATTPASQVTEATQSDSPQTVWQLNLTGENAYRAFRIPSLYPGVSWQK
ncbi:MAG TPA: aryl-sulfate sulfotransferase [Candidatus Sulfotelmatobacter sp.]